MRTESHGSYHFLLTPIQAIFYFRKDSRAAECDIIKVAFCVVLLFVLGFLGIHAGDDPRVQVLSIKKDERMDGATAWLL
jgi:hypothetical protein